MKYTFTTFFILSHFILSAQLPMKVGEWTTYLPKREGFAVTQSSSKIYYSTGRSVVSFSKDDLSNSEITRTDGLSETTISIIKYDKFNDQLIIAYASGNIDIVTQKGIININYIKENRNIINQKKINDIHIHSGSLAYIAADFGIIEWDLKKQEFKSTTFTPTPAKSVTTSNNDLFAGTTEGIFTTSINNNAKINFTSWKMLSGESGLPALYEVKGLVSKNNSLYAHIENQIYQRKPNETFKVVRFDVPSNFNIRWISGEGEHILVGFRDNQTNSTIRAIKPNGEIVAAGAACANRTIYGIEDEKNRVWLADEWREFRFTTSGLNGGCSKKELDSPLSFSSSHIETLGTKVLFASGGASENYAILSNRSGVYTLDSNNWNNLAGAFYPIIDQTNYLNFVSVAPHPTKNKMYAASYFSGIMSYDYDTNKFEFFNTKNSSISPETDRIAFVKFDKKGTLWASNYFGSKPIVALTSENIWYSFQPPSGNRTLAKIAVDDRNYKWFTVIGNPGGVLVFDDGAKIADPSDDRYKYFSTSNSAISGGSIYSISSDKDGEVWVGTSQGPVIFDCDPFDDNCKGSVRKVLEDSIVGLLLSTEEVFAIEFDGGNRKWFGTRNGIFVQSADGNTQVHRFTTENSPLLANTIYALKFDDRRGLMYIGTSEGMQAYQTETFGAKTIHSENVYAFPNPVRPGYTGDIAIRGLGRDATVKITDINGQLIYETNALGGQANWNGSDYNGRRASPGVYLVFSSSQDGFERVDGFVTKIMIIE